MPEHHHAGREFTLVLHGSFTDATGAFGAGDFAETNEQIVHSPAVARDCGCLCLVSSEAPMVLNSWPARVIQRMLGSPY
jgi:putative transcriptional regulator